MRYKTRDGRTVYNVRKALIAKGFFLDVHEEYVLGRALHVLPNGNHYASGKEHPNDVPVEALTSGW